MKLNVISAAAHNLAMSFLNFGNQVSGIWVLDLIRELTAISPSRQLLISLYPPSIDERWSEELQNLVREYQCRVEPYFLKHSIMPSSITRLELEFKINARLGLDARVSVVDSRGKCQSKSLAL